MKKICVVFLLALTVIFSCSLSYGADRFIPIGDSPEGYAYIDTYNISKTGNIYTCYLRLPATQEMQHFFGNYSYSIELIQINPITNLYTHLNIDFYDALDRLINNCNFTNTSEWKPIVANTSIECATRMLTYIEQKVPHLIHKETANKKLLIDFYMSEPLNLGMNYILILKLSHIIHKQTL